MRQQGSDEKRCKIKYETMTCNGKAISKVMRWGMILNMIRDKNGTGNRGGMVACRTDQEHWVF
jgi:hypothetical protein